VQREIAYENSTYGGDERLRDPATIAGFPETLAELWPHTRYFGADFQDLLSQFKFMRSDWALDIGTASCWTSRLLAQTGAQTIALDVNDAEYYGLRTADLLFERHKVYFERVLESMTRLPFGDGTINYVFFNASLHHTPDLSRTLAECYRVLKPGGTVAMVNEALVSWRHRLFPSRGELTDTGSHHEISYAQFDAACRATGFLVHYGLTSHVREKLRDRLTEKPARFACRVLESFPWLQNQLKSSQIILAKPNHVVALPSTLGNTVDRYRHAA
jgi:ubiquinone/menaquinone biosynthesis C-methylase UbiE